MTVYRKKLFVPKAVSASIKVEKGNRVVSLKIRPGQTKAFVGMGSSLYRLPRDLSPQQRYYKLKEIGYHASHFIKPWSPRAKRIRALLERNGIKVEKVVQDLGNGTALFEKTGFSLDSPQGQRIFFRARKKTLKEIGKTLQKMHSLGVTHNHLHAGNIALTKKGEVVLLDFGLTSASSKERARKGLNATSIAKDLFLITDSIANIEGAKFDKKKIKKKGRMPEIVLQFLENYPPETAVNIEKGFKILLERVRILEKKK